MNINKNYFISGCVISNTFAYENDDLTEFKQKPNAREDTFAYIIAISLWKNLKNVRIFRLLDGLPYFKKYFIKVVWIKPIKEIELSVYISIAFGFD